MVTNLSSPQRPYVRQDTYRVPRPLVSPPRLPVIPHTPSLPQDGHQPALYLYDTPRRHDNHRNQGPSPPSWAMELNPPPSDGRVQVEPLELNLDPRWDHQPLSEPPGYHSNKTQGTHGNRDSHWEQHQCDARGHQGHNPRQTGHDWDNRPIGAAPKRGLHHHGSHHHGSHGNREVVVESGGGDMCEGSDGAPPRSTFIPVLFTDRGVTPRRPPPVLSHKAPPRARPDARSDKDTRLPTPRGSRLARPSPRGSAPPKIARPSTAPAQSQQHESRKRKPMESRANKPGIKHGKQATRVQNQPSHGQVAPSGGRQLMVTMTTRVYHHDNTVTVTTQLTRVLSHPM